MRRDLDTLNRELDLVRAEAQKVGLPVSAKQRHFTLADYDKFLMDFVLMGDTQDRMPNPAGFLQPTFLDNANPTVSSCQPLIEQLQASGSSTLSVQRREDNTRLKLEQESTGCRALTGALRRRKIELWVRNLFTSFRDRWFDSVIIDIFIYIIIQYWKYRHLLYVNSAQTDLNLHELAQTPRCFRYILSPLYRDHHWTILFIDHETREIFYLNSDVVDRHTCRAQTAPIHQCFPGYRVHIIPCIKQCDNSSCGPYVCYWAYCFLYRRHALLRISCPNIRRCRTFIRHMVLLNCIVSKLYSS